MTARLKISWIALTICGVGVSAARGQVVSSPRDLAKAVHERIAGVPPTPEKLAELEAHVAQGDVSGAARIAMANSNFYNLTLRSWIGGWTNADKSEDVDLNDYTATVIGMIRDDVPFDKVLYDDIIYTANDALVSANGTDTGKPIRPYSTKSNTHYTDLQTKLLNGKAFDLADPNVLVRKSQSAVTGIPATAGVITTRAAGDAFFSAGTNRRMFRFLSMNYLCRDLPQIHDTTVPDFRVRRDVDRQPGGDSRVYKNSCVGCHAIQDAFGGAFAYYNFINQNEIVYTPGSVQAKYNQNGQNFPDGYRTTDDGWLNLASVGQNAALGWRDHPQAKLDKGNGARSLGMVLSRTKAFSQCMADRVFARVCLRAPAPAEAALLTQSIKDFEKDGAYNMKSLFADATAICFRPKQ